MASTPPPTVRKSPIRTLLLGEAAATAGGAIACIVAPAPILRLVLNNSLTFPLTDSNEPSLATQQLLQWTGVFFLTLCVPLVLSSGDNARAKGSRRITYMQLGFGELVLVTLLLVQSANGAAGALSPKFLWGAAATLGGTLLARGWILGFRPEWFEDSSVESGHKRRSSNR